MNAKKVGGNETDNFFESLQEPIAALASKLRRIIRKAVPNASESMKWNMPVYAENHPICAIRPCDDYVALQFYGSGTSLLDPDGLLEGTGKKMRHVKIRSKNDIKAKLFTSWIQQAARNS